MWAIGTCTRRCCLRNCSYLCSLDRTRDRLTPDFSNSSCMSPGSDVRSAASPSPQLLRLPARRAGGPTRSTVCLVLTAPSCGCRASSAFPLCSSISVMLANALASLEHCAAMRLHACASCALDSYLNSSRRPYTPRRNPAQIFVHACTRKVNASQDRNAGEFVCGDLFARQRDHLP